MPLDRRELLKLLGSSTVFCSVATASPLLSGAAAAPPLSFPQGVASGDPTQSSVVLWTRALPGHATEDALPLELELALDPDFSKPLLRQALAANANDDFTVRVWVDDLQPDQIYFYRFTGAGGGRSRTGRTRTAPAVDSDRDIRLAFSSCQNFEQGYYTAWAQLLAEDRQAAPHEQLDFVLQLGDFIYERSWDRRQDGSAQSRRLPDFPEGVIGEGRRHARSLEDYRHLYRHYLSDPWLQAARARWPFVHTWDDHEFSDNNVQSYSSYDGALLLEAARKRDANRAWVEYVPCALDELQQQNCHGLRPVALTGNEVRDNSAARDSLRIYRSLRWGKRLDLILSDNRSYRSAPCLEDGEAEALGQPMASRELVAVADGGRAYQQGNPPEFLPLEGEARNNPWREREPGTCLGETQREWLIERLAGSSAQWKLWANPLPLLPLYIDLSSIPFAGYQDSVFNIDAWMGYPHEASDILGRLAQRGATGLVSFSGDHHMHGAGLVHSQPCRADTAAVMADFNCAGISSTPLFESVLAAAQRSHSGFMDLVCTERDGQCQPNWNLSLCGGVLASLAYAKTGSERLARWLGPNTANPGLRFVDSTANGYGLATFGREQLRVELVAVDARTAPGDLTSGERYRALFTLPHWQQGETPALQGPHFTGEAPFPFAGAG